ncbi:hypothetical protein GbCGDNIH6_8259 [Granulibacter bethesdensis]|nr:hypothetical protein GbCGDNIH6_8259 [Granulibacter bethesdensis]
MFPACAGMNRLKRTTLVARCGVPRLRGDEPGRASQNIMQILCSPPARG